MKNAGALLARSNPLGTLTRARLRPAEKAARRDFEQEAAILGKVQGMAKKQQALVMDLTDQRGMAFAETDDELAYLVFVAPGYPEQVAKDVVDRHARAIESMAGDGARRLPLRPRRDSRAHRSLWGLRPRTGTFTATAGAEQSGAAKKAYAAVCKTLASECVCRRRRRRLLGLTRGSVVAAAGRRRRSKKRR